MKNKSMKRYDSFCRRLENLNRSRTKNPNDDMVLNLLSIDLICLLICRGKL